MDEHTTTSSASIADHCVGPRGHGGRLPARLRRSWRGLATGSALALLLLPLPAASRSTSAREVRGDAVAPALSAPAAGGTWSDTGPLNMPRHGHTLTLLPDGTVLAIGSGGNDSAAPVVAEAERYSPGTGTWALQASLRPPRRRHCATLLPSGLVVVAGGDGGPDQAPLPGALTFDPTTGALISAGTLQRPRSFCTLTALPDGRALLIGGGAPGFQAEVEVFDPATSAWTVVGALKQAREYHTATLLPDGSVLVAGGAGAGGRLASLERFDPRAGQSTIVATLSTPRGFHTATLLPDGTVLIAGGDGGGGDGFPATAERFEPATNSVRPAGTMRWPRRHHTATLLPDGLVLVAGGDKNSPLASTELYDPAGDTWTEAAPMRWPRRWHTATLLPDGRVLVAGGAGEGGPLASAEIYTPAPPPCADPPPALAAWWPLDETSGNTAEDIAGDNDGSYVNQPAVVPDGHVAASRRFDGATQSIQVPDAADGALDFGFGDFTVDAWVRLDADARGVRTILDKRSFSPVRGYAVFAIDGKLALQLGDGSAPGGACGSDPATTPCTSYNSGIAINDGQWHFVAVTVDRDGVGTFYVDGQTATFDPRKRAGSLDNAAPLVLARHATNGGFWKGALDEVEIFGWAVPAAELAAIRQAGVAGKCKDGGPGEPWGDKSLQQTLDEMFAPLNPADVPGGILLDRTVAFSHLATSIPSTDVVYTADAWRQVYREMYNGALDRGGRVTPEQIGNLATAVDGGGHIPIAVQHFSFGRVRPDALDRGLIELRDGKVYDVPNRSESPYQAHTLFAAAPLAASARGPEVTFVLPRELFFTNQPGTLDTVQIDFDDGQGFRDVRAGAEVRVTYTGLPESPAEVTKRLRLRWVPRQLAGQALAGPRQLPPELKAEMSVDIGMSPVWEDGNEVLFFTSASSKPGAPDGAAKVTIQKGNNSPTACLTRPLIFVEGIDFGFVLWKPAPGGWMYDYFSQLYQDRLLKKRGDMGFECLNGQCAKQYPQLAEGKALLEKLASRGDDVVFIDFWDGADYIQNDAAVLQRVIEYTRDHLCAGSRLAVVGASMGGLISRHALATMEKAGNPHCASTWVAFDSPQEGANIPVGAQHFVDFFSEVSETAYAAKMNKLGRPAARQLLIAQTNPASLHGQWQTELANLGYPQVPRRVAVPNGSTSGKPLAFGDGAPIVYVTKPIDWGWLTLWAWSYALPGHDQGLKFDAWLRKPALKQKNKIDKRVWSYEPLNLPALDNGPGGLTDALTSFEVQLVKIDGLQVLPVISAEDWVTFIPTASALGWAPGIAEPHQVVPADAVLPFSDYYEHGDNQAHVTITQGNIDYLTAQLDVGSPVPATLPNGAGAGFNFGDQLTVVRQSISVGAGGHLSVNGPGATDGGAGKATSPGSSFEVQVIPEPACGSADTVIDVQSGGMVELGTADRKGILRLKAGTSLRLRAGGKLVVRSDSVLILEPGATLIYEKGAEIQLVDSKSVIQVQGRVQVGDGATFTFAGGGYLHFIVNDTNAPSIQAGKSSFVRLEGTGKSDWVLQVSGKLWVDDKLSLFVVQNGAVDLHGDIRLGSRYRFVKAGVAGSGTLISMGRWGSAIVDSDLNGVGIDAQHSLNGGQLSLTDTRITNTGVAVSITGGGFTFNRVTIDDTVEGIISDARTNASYFVNGTINAQQAGIAETGSPSAPLTVKGTVTNPPVDTVKSEMASAVTVEGASLILREATVHGATAGDAMQRTGSVTVGDGAVLDMSTVTGAAGCNDLSYSPEEPHLLIGLQWPDNVALDAGFNRLFNGPLKTDFKDKMGPIIMGRMGDAWIPLWGVTSWPALSATYNRWSQTVPGAQPQSALAGQIQVTASGQPMIAVFDDHPGDYPCPPEHTTNPDTWTGSAAWLRTCTTCPTLNTADFRGVPYHTAIAQAMGRMARDTADPARDDLVAVRQLGQILTTPVDTAKPELAWLRGFAARMLGDGFGNALATERISTTVAAGPLPEAVRQVQAAYGFLAMARNTPDRGRRFGYELAGALVHRQVGRRAEAGAALAAIDPAGLTPRQQATLARWQRLVAAEIQLANGDISLEQFRLIVAPPAPYVPPPAAVYLPAVWHRHQ